jgi:Fe-S-cluster containining protein
LLEDNEFCKKCAKCCAGTEMILTRSDIIKLERRGYRNFYTKRGGFYKLLNVNGKCVFLGPSNECLVYEDRPAGCRVYPLVYDEERGIVLDEECPLASSVSCVDLVMGVDLVRVVLREIELTYNYRVDWELVEKSITTLLSKCID